MRSDLEIVVQTNELAAALSLHFGFVAPEGHRFDKREDFRDRRPWIMACFAQEVITLTNPDDAISALEEGLEYDPTIKVAPGRASVPHRTDQEIVDQTNALAKQICDVWGYETPDDYKFYESANPRAETVWSAACKAQEILTQTDVQDALINLEDGAEATVSNADPSIITPHEILGYLGFNIPKEGVAINVHDYLLHTESLKLLGDLISADAIPDEKLNSLRDKLHHFANDKGAPDECDETSLLKLRTFLRIIFSNTYGKQMDGTSEAGPKKRKP